MEERQQRAANLARGVATEGAAAALAAQVERGQGRLRAGDGAELHWRSWAPAAAAPSEGVLVVMHGYGEHSACYDELAACAVGRGLTVYAMDARGHGRSPGQRGYIGRYQQYVDDLIAFVVWVRERTRPARLSLLGHSNGGLISIRAVQVGLGPLFKLVLSSPLVDLHPRRRVVPDWVACGLSALLPRLPLPSTIAPEELSHDAAKTLERTTDPWAHRVATPRWYWSALQEAKLAFAAAPQIVVPTRVVVAGADSLVKPEGVREFFARLGSQDKALLERPGAYHESLNELDRAPLHASLMDWIAMP